MRKFTEREIDKVVLGIVIGSLPSTIITGALMTYWVFPKFLALKCLTM